MYYNENAVNSISPYYPMQPLSHQGQ
jgi:hypothetical protein